MRKFSIFLVFIFLCSCFCFVGCSAYSQVVKASKELSEYELNIEVDDENKKLYCLQNVNFKNKYDVILKEICFNIYPSAFREDAKILPYTSANSGKVFPNGVKYGDIEIKKVKIDEKISVFTLSGEDNNVLWVPLENILEPDDCVKIEIEFVLTLPECTHRLGYFEGSINLGNFYPILAIYKNGEFLTYPYYSTGDPFYSNFANYQVRITYPDYYNISSTGKCLKSEIKQSCKIDTIKALAVRDFAIFLTKSASVLSKNIEKTQICYVGYRNDMNISELLDISCSVFTFFNKIFGKYPYLTLTVVKAPFVHGGMEYPNVVVISDSITDKFDIAKVIAHEIAHQWWYALVGNNEVTEAWLDESLAEYSTLLFFEAHPEFGVSYDELVNQATAMYSLYADIVNVVDGNIKTSMLLPVNEYNSEYEYSYMVYVKGMIMFDSLRDIVGAKKLNQCFKKYFSAYKFKIATTDDLIASFRKTAGRDIEGFFDSWLSGRTIVGEIT